VATFEVTTLVRFSGQIEADSQAEAEELGYYYDNLNYDSVYEVEVEEVEVCEECDTPLHRNTWDNVCDPCAESLGLGEEENA
jgi:hypothetical protein